MTNEEIKDDIIDTIDKMSEKQGHDMCPLCFLSGMATMANFFQCQEGANDIPTPQQFFKAIMEVVEEYKHTEHDEYDEEDDEGDEWKDH